MKKIIAVMGIVSLFLFSCSAGHADDMLKKLGRGAANMVTFPLEIFKGIGDANERSGFLAGMTWGIVQGFYKAGVRGLVGVYEVVTFPFPLPENYEPILTSPEFFGE